MVNDSGWESLDLQSRQGRESGRSHLRPSLGVRFLEAFQSPSYFLLPLSKHPHDPGDAHPQHAGVMYTASVALERLASLVQPRNALPEHAPPANAAPPSHALQEETAAGLTASVPPVHALAKSTGAEANALMGGPEETAPRGIASSVPPSVLLRRRAFSRFEGGHDYYTTRPRRSGKGHHGTSPHWQHPSDAVTAAVASFNEAEQLPCFNPRNVKLAMRMMRHGEPLFPHSHLVEHHSLQWRAAQAKAATNTRAS